MDALVASLGMYDFPFVAEANARLWAAIGAYLTAAGIDAPTVLDRAEPHDLWTNPRLVFGQTCGYPFVTTLRERVTLLATPIYDFEGCVGPNHCSFVVTSAISAKRSLAGFEGARAAINARDSNSGMNLFRGLLAPIARGRPMFIEVVTTGLRMPQALPRLRKAQPTSRRSTVSRMACCAVADRSFSKASPSSVARNPRRVFPS